MSIEGRCPKCGHYTNELTKDGVCIDCYCQLDHQSKDEDYSDIDELVEDIHDDRH